MFDYAKDNMERMPYEYYLSAYSQADRLAISNRLGIPYDMKTRRFFVMFLGRSYFISYPEFEVAHDGTGEDYYTLEEDVYAKILLLRYLLNASVFPHNGDFRAYRELPNGELYFRQFQGRCTSRLNRLYGNRPEVFQRIMEVLGATKIHQGDVGYELEILDNLYLRFLFWQGDDEFPSSAQILFSSNFPAAFGTYDLAEVGEICINTFRGIEKRLCQREENK